MSRSPAASLLPGNALTLAHVADGAEGLVLAALARAVAAGRDAPAVSLIVVCRDGPRMAALSRGIAFFAPEIARLESDIKSKQASRSVAGRVSVSRARHWACSLKRWPAVSSARR